MSEGSDKKDLTRLEDISEFLHEDDPAADEVFDQENQNNAAAPPELPTDFESNESEVDFSDLQEDSLEEEQEEAFASELETSDLEEDFEANSNEEFQAFETSDDFESDGLDTALSADFSLDSDDSLESSDANDFSAGDDNNDFELEANQASFDTAEFEASDESPPLMESSEEFIESNEASQEKTPPSPSPALKETSDLSSSKSILREESQNFFKDIKEFGESISLGQMAKGGNPPYGIIIREIKYKEDASDILEILREMRLVRSDNEAIIQKSLQNGALYLSQLSEFMGIILTHKLRRFDVDILFGLADELRPSPTESLPHKGLISRDELHLNLTLSKEWKPSGQKIDIENIIISTSPYLDNYMVKRHLGVITEQTIIPILDLEIPFTPQKQAGHRKATDIVAQNLQIIYHELKEKLKTQAIEKGGNGILGLNFHVSTLGLSPSGTKRSEHYQVTALGNLVWLSDTPKPEGIKL